MRERHRSSWSMARTEGFAPAKINLTLHVTGQREDGYHLLDSLVVFADIGDRITVMPSGTLSLFVTGPMAAGVPVDGRNLVLKAAQMMGVGAEIHLEKHLPAAAGIGGGSSDAAATLRALVEMTGRGVPRDVLALGADVPVCMLARAARMAGIGEIALPVVGLPDLFAVLVNPRVAISTPEVFKRLACKDNARMGPTPTQWDGAAGLCDWLAHQRNDLQAPAVALEPVIGRVLDALSLLPGCLLSRMSGSGATCYALFGNRDEAEGAAGVMRAAHGDWWVRAAQLR